MLRAMTELRDATAVTPCPVCEGARFATAFTAVGHRFERCRGCRFVRMADAPTPAELAAFYESDRLSGESGWQEHEKNLVRFDGILAAIERHVRPGRLLDVGCSLGTSLVAARKRGWTAVGLELSRPAAEFGRKEWDLDIRMQTLDEAGFAPGSFDAVLMHHTLEHVAAPDRVLAQVRDVLAVGGVTYQSLPNHDSAKARLFGRHFGWGITPEHVSHFSRRTLTRLLRRIGFTVVDVSTWSYAQDPRFLFDLIHRLGLEGRFMRACGKPGQPIDARTYLDFLHRRRWAHFVCNRLWPARLVRWLRLGEDLHLIARK